MTDWLEIPPPDEELRRRIARKLGPKLDGLDPAARELYMIGAEWSTMHGTRGHIPDHVVGKMTAVAESRCRARGEIAD